MTFRANLWEEFIKVQHMSELAHFLVTGNELWVWQIFSMWMGSRQDSYHTYKVSCILDHGHRSYKHFIFLGKMLKMAVPPCPHCDANPKDFHNFWSKRGQEQTQRFSWGYNKIPRRSSLNSDAWNRQKWPFFQTSTRNSRLPVDLTKKSKRANRIVLTCSTCVPNFITIGQTTDFSWIFKSV